MKQKKFFAFLSAAICVIGFLGSLPEDFANAVSEAASTAVATATTTLDQLLTMAEEDTSEVTTIKASNNASDVDGVYIDADYSTDTLTAVLTDSDGNDIDTNDLTGATISYEWHQSFDNSNFSEVSDSTASTLTFEDGYYYFVTVTVDSIDYTSTAKYITTAIAKVKIQNDIYRDGVLTAVLVNSEGDILYFEDDSGNNSAAVATGTTNTVNFAVASEEPRLYTASGDKTTYNSDATYTWYRSNATYDNTTTNVTPYAGATIYTNIGAEESGTTYEKMAGDDFTETREENTLEPITTDIGGGSYYYYVVVTIDGDDYTASPRIANIYTGITVEIEQEKDDDGNVTLQMVVYDDNGDVMLDENDDYYYNDAYTTTWYKSKEYFASTGNGTTADENSAVTTSATIPLGYAPQDYYTESNYMRVSNDNTTTYTNTITVTSEEGRYYYVDINKNKTNGTAEAGADPVFVRNCKSMVVIEDQIAADGTFLAVVYDASGNRVVDTSAYTYTWYETVSGTTTYTDAKDYPKDSDPGRFISSYDAKAYYFDSGKFSWNSGTALKTSEYGGTLPGDVYGLVREYFSEEIDAVSDIFAGANYAFDTGGTGYIVRGSDYNDGSTCNVAKDEGQLRYYYVIAVDGSGTTYTSSAKYVKYSNQIENGGFQDYQNTNGSSSTFEASTMAYWETTNKGYTESYSTARSSNEQYYRMHPLLEIGNYLGGTAYGTYGNYYSYPGLTYDKEDTTKIQKSYIERNGYSDGYLEMGYGDASTTDYLYKENQFCEISSTDSNTLYQTVMTVPDLPLCWSLTHHARTGSGTPTTITDSVVYKDANDEEVTVKNLGATDATVLVAIDIMYVVIMNETDAESLLANGATLADQQTILNNMILSITKSATPQVKQTSEDGSSYLARYDCDSYTYDDGTEYKNISVWRVQTDSTKVQLTFSSTEAEAAANATKNEDLLAYYAKTYGTVKSYSYTSGNYSYATFYTEAETYADTYNIPDGQYVSRYFFVAGNSSNSVGTGTVSSAYTTGGLSFGTYTDDNGEEQTISDYNKVTKATNGASTGNFIDNVVFTQQLQTTVNYWLYDSEKGTYVLKSGDTETSEAIPGNIVVAEKASDYYAKYNFVGSYLSASGGDENTPDTEMLGTVTLFRVDTDNALVLDLYYCDYALSIKKTIDGLPADLTYADFANKLQIALYPLTEGTGGGYSIADDAVIDGKYLEYAVDSETGKGTLSYVSGYTLEKGTYLLTETVHLLLTDSFYGWSGVEMSLANGTLQYDDSLGGYILVIGEESDQAGSKKKDAVIEVSLVNTYQPVAVQSTKSVLFGKTDVDEINEGLCSTESDDTKLNYESLTSYDNAQRSVDDTDLTDDNERLSVLSGDTLTYRMDLTSTGNADSEEIKVTDTVPDGCTLQVDSIQILKQACRKNTGKNYGVVQTILTSNSSGDSSWSITDSDGVEFTITYDATNREITWTISEMDAYERYYVEYAVTVNQIKASKECVQLTNTAQWTYLSKMNNGATDVSVDMKSVEDPADSGKYTYTVTFSNLSDCTATELRNVLPDGFVIDTDSIAINGKAIDTTSYKITYYDENGVATDDPDEIASFTIAYDSGIAQNEQNEIILTFQGTQTDTTGTEIRNAARMTYTKDSEIYTSVVARGDAVTNEVVTDVTHLYLEVEKELVESTDKSTVDADSTDTQQTFLFLVAYYAEGSNPSADDPDSITYVTIQCENGTGSNVLQTDKRGTYLVTEVTDWSNTDYDYISANGEGATAAGDCVTIDYASGGAYLNSNGTFATALGLVSEDHANAVFCNTASPYAYRSGQAYAKNAFAAS